MADEDEGTSVSFKSSCKSSCGFDIQMIAWLIEEEQVVWLEKELGQCNSGTFSTRVETYTCANATYKTSLSQSLVVEVKSEIKCKVKYKVISAK